VEVRAALKRADERVKQGSAIMASTVGDDLLGERIGFRGMGRLGLKRTDEPQLPLSFFVTLFGMK